MEELFSMEDRLYRRNIRDVLLVMQQRTVPVWGVGNFIGIEKTELTKSMKNPRADSDERKINKGIEFPRQAEV